jgi:hypothetical protein
LLEALAPFAVDSELDGQSRRTDMNTLITTSEEPVSARTAVPQIAPAQAVSLRAAPLRAASMFGKPQNFWPQNREASLNWLALGLLLAAWNAVDGGDDRVARRRPDSLRGYLAVSVRAVQHSADRFDDANREGDL